ncbi:MAG: hypothetical protein P4L83_23065 [Nevskia sp.]|nr:hypothetical protein [Nevskia sp.]
MAVRIFVAAGLYAVPYAALADLFVIANPSVTGLSTADVRDVYLGEKRFAGSTPLKPVDNAAQQSHFLSTVVKMEGDKYNSWWIKKAFRDGLVQPDVKSADVEVIEYVKATPGAVGYVGAAPPAGVTVVGKY